MEHLSNALQREHELLGLLLFKLVETRLLVEAEETRFLARATREVERARHRTREADLLRAALVERLEPRGEDGEVPTLRALAAAAPEPWGGIFRDHHEVLCGQVAEIEVVANQNACLAQAGISRISGAARQPVLVGPGGATMPDATLSRLAEGAAYEAVLGAAARLRMPALLSFLR